MRGQPYHPPGSQSGTRSFRECTDEQTHPGEVWRSGTEYRAVLALKEKVLSPEHPDTLRACFDLARCLRADSEIREAVPFAQHAADGARKVLGLEHPDTKKYEQLRQQLLVKSN